ncbi:hypothetical protein EVAR_100400_1 [Eumeta japonica]|uniref:Uncharacterized protein n=1 Tax=Eumeta variegata TaxID=151549 RepID=A0A4C2ACZ8_EUMVA|nr:hypothetical protein EVAR_100400_1 [Eumeta japonica]
MATFNVQRSIPVWNQNREQDRDQERERKGDCFIRKTFVALLTSLVKEYGFFWFESTTEPWSGLWSITSSIYVKDPKFVVCQRGWSRGVCLAFHRNIHLYHQRRSDDGLKLGGSRSTEQS